MPARRTATVLKILNGSAAHNPSYVRDDLPVKGKLTEPPPFITLNEDERRTFDWLVKEGAVPRVHGAIDSLTVAHAARISVRLERCLAKVTEYGEVMKVKQTLRVQPYAYQARVLTDQLRSLLGDSGMTLAGRLKNAPPAGTLGPSSIPSWDEIDT